MNPETAVTFTRGHFNQVVFAVYTLVPRELNNGCVRNRAVSCLARRGGASNLASTGE